MEDSISLSQKIYLLGIHPNKGGIISTAYTAMDYCLLGMLFLELYQEGNIKFENKRIVVLHTKSDNKIHRFILEKLSKSKKPLRIAHWINKFYFSLKHIRKMVQTELMERRLIKMNQKRFLFFTWKKPYIQNKQFVFKLVSEIENRIFARPETKEEIFLLTFVKPAGLLRRIFPQRDKRKLANKRIIRLMKENQGSTAVADAISAAKAVISSVATTTAAHQTVA